MATVPVPGPPTPEGQSSSGTTTANWGHAPGWLTPTTTKKAKPKTSTPSSDNTGNMYAMYPLLPEWAYSQDATGSGQPVDQGYDAQATLLNPLRKNAALANANAILTDGTNGWQMSVLVSDVSIDSGIIGTTAQSQMVQDWYPHNFTAPSITVTGWSLDQTDYGTLCEFIHNCQYKSITSNNSSWPSFMTQLWVFGRDRLKGEDGTRTTGRSVSLSQPGTVMPGHTSDPFPGLNGVYYNQSLRGAHQPIVAKGYVQTMPREHGQFQYAVEWQFSFVVAAMLQGLYSESASLSKSILGLSTNPTATWANMLNEVKSVGYSTNSAAENKAALAYAASHVTGPIPGAPATGGSTSGGGTSGSNPSPITSGGKLTVRGVAITTSQLAVTNTALAVAKAAGAPQIVAIAMIYAGMGESSLSPTDTWQNSTSQSTATEAVSWLHGGDGFLGGGGLGNAKTYSEAWQIANATEGNAVWLGPPYSSYPPHTHDSYALQSDPPTIAEATAIVAAYGGF